MKFLLIAFTLFAALNSNVALAQTLTVLDEVAQGYVRLSLEAGEREPEYVDAYYGPPEWAAEAKQNPRSVEELQADAVRLKEQALQIDPELLDQLSRKRRTFLIGQLTAAEARLAMHNGTHFSFDEEALKLFGVHIIAEPLNHFDKIITEIDRLLPGPGPLSERVATYRNRFAIPIDKVDKVIRAAIGECRHRTMNHMRLPEDESFSLELTTNKPWQAYNYYKGNDTSVIQVNTDLPVLIDSVVGLGCHEGYPGHHVYNMLLEQRLARTKRWVEFTIYPLYGPQSLIAEGSANYGIELAFPGTQRQAFEARHLYPLAGFDPKEAIRMLKLGKAFIKLGGANITIARDYLDGRIDRATAGTLLQKYYLMSVTEAEKSLDFTDHYRSYVINYGIGRDMVKAHVESAGDHIARWREMARILSEPTSPMDLLAAH